MCVFSDFPDSAGKACLFTIILYSRLQGLSILIKAKSNKKKKVFFALKFILDLDCQPMYKYTSLGTHIMRPGLAGGVRGKRLKTSVFGHLSFLPFVHPLLRASEGATAHKCP